jgi:peptidyl-prolyl cis-trans isomerase A (cyclophilin A)
MKKIAMTLFSIVLFSTTAFSKMEDGLYAKFNTSKGSIIVKLLPQKAPLTVCNFVGLAEGKITNTAKPAGVHFYDGLKFHRVIAQFMIQGGDPQGNGTGGPGYAFADEFDDSLKFTTPGVLAMANSGPATNGSQFFITHVPTPWLNGKHTIFGHVVEGQNIVDSIKQEDVITSIEIIRVGTEAKAYVADDKTFAELKAKAVEKAAAEKLKEADRSQELPAFEAWVKKNYPMAKKTASGLYYVVIKEGAGANPTIGQNVKVHYTGMFNDGKKFDSSVDRGQPFEFPLGQGRVIKGWDEGIALLNKGEKAKLLIPYTLGYGEAGYPGAIPGKATLIFDVELIDFK